MFNLQFSNLERYETKFSSGMDLKSTSNRTLSPGSYLTFGTGVFIKSLPWYTKLLIKLGIIPEVQIRSRSGLASKGIFVSGGIGTVDADYRGEWRVTLLNVSSSPIIIEAGQRIAQAVCCFTTRLNGVPVSDVERGDGGFGSTGTK
jgi:dUTP pyrophosphatase